MHDVSVDVGQAEVASLVTVGHSFVVDAKLMQNGRVEVVNVDRVLGDIVAEVVGFAVDRATFDACSGHPLCVAPRVVIAAVV